MRFFVLTLLILLLLPFPAYAEILAELEDSYLIQQIDEEVFEAGKYITEDMIYLQAQLSLSISEMSLITTNNDRKNPTINDGYYTINGNKDIVIHGNEKQLLYTNAKDYWDLSASYTLPVYNVGYLTYNNTTLCDINELQNRYKLFRLY